MMTFETYETLKPVLTEHTIANALRIILKQYHADMYNDELIEGTALCAEKSFTMETTPVMGYAAYVQTICNAYVLDEALTKFYTENNPLTDTFKF